jgi:hypothetical protein
VNLHRSIHYGVFLLALAGALRGAPAGAQTPTIVETTLARPATASEALPVVEAGAIARKWGIKVESLRVTASGYMLDLRYRVLDARKARPLFRRKVKPILRDEATGAEMMVPVPPKTGALRNSNDPKAGRSYFMFFGNPARFIKPGSLVTVTIGSFSVSGIQVEVDAAPAGVAQK